ncbi:hypothetical protein QA596_05400 [Balneolales bacterium ANBcel1]|nr:hypothetical protein [Balneolales bacterium ANBcel1]
MEKAAQISTFEMWNIMEILSWVLYSLAIVIFILSQLNVLEATTLVSVNIHDTSITFGYSTVIFLLGAFFHSRSVFIERKVKHHLGNNTFISAFGFFLGMSAIAFLVVVLITVIEG